MIINQKKIMLYISLMIIVLVVSLSISKIDVSAKNKKTDSCNNISCENILLLGDSITDWYPIDEIFGDLPIVGSGVAGYETTDILKRMDSMVYKYNPTKVFILIGTNDLKYKDDNEEKVYDNIVKIITGIKDNRPKAQIYFQSIYPVNRKLGAAEERYNDEIKAVNKMMKEYCQNNDIEYIDMYSELQDGNGDFDESYTKDGLHPNDLGYARISRVLTQYIYQK